MFLKLKNALPPDDLAEVRKALDAVEFVDGTTSGSAMLKSNLQSAWGSPGLEDTTRKVVEAVTKRPDFAAFAAPRMVNVIFNRYDAGMFYKNHLDAALMGGKGNKTMRTDISFTLFLSEPADYEGGELMIQTPMGEVRAKEAAGTAVVYPANLLHRVETVTSGVRLAAVGWVQSVLRHEYQRDLMLELQRLRAEILRDHPESGYRERVDRIRENLLRAWAEF